MMSFCVCLLNVMKFKKHLMVMSPSLAGSMITCGW